LCKSLAGRVERAAKGKVAKVVSALKNNAPYTLRRKPGVLWVHSGKISGTQTKSRQDSPAMAGLVVKVELAEAMAAKGNSVLRPRRIRMPRQKALRTGA
jgi:hypothetical protein